MLQVITGMYFRDVPLNETEHSWAFYTNTIFPERVQVELPIGYLTPAEDRAAVNTVLAHFTERLEAVRPDGTDEFMISTGGNAIADDLAVVLSFALNATFTPVREKADRLIRAASRIPHSPVPADILLRTFTPQVELDDGDLDNLTAFMTDLLALNRKVYERAMRAMRRIVTASERVAEDPTLAYTDYVVALESLSAGFEVAPSTWERLDSRRRRIFDPVLTTLTAEQADNVRAAILEAERSGIKNRYIEFVLAHVRPSFFREEATGCNQPVRRASLRRVMSKTYDARSKNTHELEELRRETWLLVDGAHTVTPPGESLMITHEGLNRLARHVVRTYVQRGSTEPDRSFVWRDHLPNVMQVTLAPQLYLGQPAAMHPRTAAFRAGEFIDHLIEALSGRGKFEMDMRPALGRIEKLLATQRSPAVREPMLAVYFLWHQLLPPEVHRPKPEEVMATALRELQHRPNLYTFAVALLLGADLPWSVDEVCELAEQRHEESQKSRPVELPVRLDSALWVFVAQQLWSDGGYDLARAAIGMAVEYCPGHRNLLALERDVAAGDAPDFDVRAFVLGPGPGVERH